MAVPSQSPASCRVWNFFYSIRIGVPPSTALCTVKKDWTKRWVSSNNIGVMVFQPRNKPFWPKKRQRDGLRIWYGLIVLAVQFIFQGWVHGAFFQQPQHPHCRIERSHTKKSWKDIPPSPCWRMKAWSKRPPMAERIWQSSTPSRPNRSAAWFSKSPSRSLRMTWRSGPYGGLYCLWMGPSRFNPTQFLVTLSIAQLEPHKYH